MSGFTGTFTKLGLTGLPLTTVALMLMFAALALLPVDADSQKSFFDLDQADARRLHRLVRAKAG